MKRFRQVAWIALAAGVMAALIVPLVIPVTSSGTLSSAQAAGPDATFVDIDGLSVHYTFDEYRGTEANSPLFVLLHGFGASTYSWREVRADLAMLGDVVTYDRPAFGFTERPTDWAGDSPYGSTAQLALLSGVIAQFQAPSQPVIVVGHSAGGTLAAQFGLDFPDRVSGLVLVAPAILTTGGGPRWLSGILGIPQIDRIGPLLVGGIATSGDELLERSWHDVSLLTPEIRENYRAPLTIEGWERAFWEFQKAPRDFTVADRLAEFRVPVSIITGDDDRVVATADSLRLAALIPGATLDVLTNSGHLPQEETPVAFMNALAAAIPSLTR